MNISFWRRAALTVVMAGFGVATSFGQDLMARQAREDAGLRAVDSVSIRNFWQRNLNRISADDIYTSWVTNKAHPYTSQEVPDSFRIDLSGFSMPTKSRTVTSHFGYRPAFRRMHKGMDIKVYTGDTIYAAFDGKVRVVRYDAGGYGNYIVIRHNNGLETIYGHLSKQLVCGDQEVRSGEPIGLGGNTGRSFGAHLHFETRIAGEAIDPERLFNFPNQNMNVEYYTFHKSSNLKQHSPEVQGGSSLAMGSTTKHYYKVQQGETLADIASKLSMTEEKLASENSLILGNELRSGQILRY